MQRLLGRPRFLMLPSWSRSCQATSSEGNVCWGCVCARRKCSRAGADLGQCECSPGTAVKALICGLPILERLLARACAESEGRPASAAEREQIQGEPTAALVQLQGGLERGAAAGEDAGELPPHLAALTAREAGIGSGSGVPRSHAAAEQPGEGAGGPAERLETVGAAWHSPDPDPSCDPGHIPRAGLPAKSLRSVVARPAAAVQGGAVRGELAPSAAVLCDVPPHLARPVAAAHAAHAPLAAAFEDAPPHLQEARAAREAGGAGSYALASGLRVSRAPAEGLEAEQPPVAAPGGGRQSDAGKGFLLASGRRVSRTSPETAGSEAAGGHVAHRSRGRQGTAGEGFAPASGRLASCASAEAAEPEAEQAHVARGSRDGHGFAAWGSAPARSWPASRAPADAAGPEAEPALEPGSEGVPNAGGIGMQAEKAAVREAPSGAGAPAGGRAGNPKSWGGPGNAAVDAVLSRFRGRLTVAGAARVRGAAAAALPDPTPRPEAEAAAPAAADGRKGNAARTGPGGAAAKAKRAADAPVQEAAEPLLKRPRVADAAAGEPAAPGHGSAEHPQAWAPPLGAAEGDGAPGGAAAKKPPPAFAVRSLEEIRAERERRRAKAGAAAASAPVESGKAEGAPGGLAPARQQATSAAQRQAAPSPGPVLANGGSVSAPAMAPRPKRAPIVFAAPPKPAQATAAGPASGAPAEAGKTDGSAPNAYRPSAAAADPADAPPGGGKPAGASAVHSRMSGSAAGGAVGAQSGKALQGSTGRANLGDTALAAPPAAGAAAQPASASAAHAGAPQGRKGLGGVPGGAPAGASLAPAGPSTAAAAAAEGPSDGVAAARVAAAAGAAGRKAAACPVAPAISAKPQYDERYMKKELIVEAGGEKLEVCHFTCASQHRQRGRSCLQNCYGEKPVFCMADPPVHLQRLKELRCVTLKLQNIHQSCR